MNSDEVNGFTSEMSKLSLAGLAIAGAGALATYGGYKHYKSVRGGAKSKRDKLRGSMANSNRIGTLAPRMDPTQL